MPNEGSQQAHEMSVLLSRMKNESTHAWRCWQSTSAFFKFAWKFWSRFKFQFSLVRLLGHSFFTLLMFLEFGLIWQDCKYAETARCGKFESSGKLSRPLTNASIPDLRKPSSVSMYTRPTLLWSITSSSLMFFCIVS